MNINVKVNVKVTNGTFSKKTKKIVIYPYFGEKNVMFPEYIKKSFDIFTKIIIATIENYIKLVGEIDV